MSGPAQGKGGPVLAIVMVGLAVIALASSAASESRWRIAAGSSSTPEQTGDALATDVIDAQTIHVAGGQTVRFIGVAAPTATECYGAEALARTKELLPPGTPIKLGYDYDRVDDGGRTLAYVYRRADGLFVNLALAQEGFARESIAAPNLAHTAELVAAAAEAEAEGKGLWAKCGAVTTTAPAPRTGGTGGTSGTSGSTTTVRTAASVRPASTAVGAAASDACHPSYAGACLPIDAPDVDCEGKGDGPVFIGGREFGVVGPDVYGLDPDKNGIACD